MKPEHDFSMRCLLNSHYQPSKYHLYVASRVFELEDGFSAEQLVEVLSTNEPKVSGSTVYMTLTMLVSVGMLSQQSPDTFIYNFPKQIDRDA